jgi:NitT/TauT family transport system ATP-binding protein
MAIVLNQIVKTYGQSTVIDHLDLILPSEGIVCLTGPSGCGKTTLMRLVSGLEKPDAGMISGVDKMVFSMVFQEDRLLPWLTAAENLDLVLHKSVSGRYLDLVRMGEDSSKCPGELSGGMRRRVALARALAFESDVLVLDEPFKGMDENLRETMIELVRSERRNRLVYLITHDAYEARRLADSILQFEGPPLRQV